MFINLPLTPIFELVELILIDQRIVPKEFMDSDQTVTSGIIL